MNKDTHIFWNSTDNVAYFASKPADWRILKRLEAFSGEESAHTALDLGCGAGRHTEMLCVKGFNTFAVDVSPEMLKATKIRTQDLEHLPTITEGTILSIPHVDNYFDVVITTGVLHQAKNVSEYKQAIQELSRVCKDNCVVCLNIFTNKIVDCTYTKVVDDDYSYITKEGLSMCLLSKELFYQLMFNEGFVLETEYSEDIVDENTGQRAVLRCDFIRRPTTVSDQYCFSVKVENNILVIGNNTEVAGNPFVSNSYDFDSQGGFYKGNFEYVHPTSKEKTMGTIESYGRAKIVKLLVDSSTENDVVLDVGAGCMNIYREFNDCFAQYSNQMLFISMDISGPFNSCNSALVKGSNRIISRNILTFGIQSDFNKEPIPLLYNSVDIVVSSMALHHIFPENRLKVFSKIYNSLKTGGKFINMDFYTPDRFRNILTQSGERGPAESSGFGMDFMDYVEVVQKVGFKFCKEGHQIVDTRGSPTHEYIERATLDHELSTPINKATYYSVLIKK